MSLLAAIAALVAGLLAICALSPGSTRWRTGLAWSICGALLALPTLVAASPPLRYGFALSASLALLKTLDLSRQPIPSGAARLLHLATLVDVRLATRRERRFEAAALLGSFAWAGLAAVALLLAAIVAPRCAHPAVHYGLRWGGALAFALAAFEVATRQTRVAARLLGFEVPELQDAPYRSRTVRELWGVRWNRAIGGWLRAHVFVPLRPRIGPALAALAVFGVSALLHAYLVGASLGLGGALLIGAFFLCQGAALALERRLGVARWPPAAARAWTLGTVLASSPLVAEPMMRLADPLLGGP